MERASTWSTATWSASFWLAAMPNLSGFYHNDSMSIVGDAPNQELKALLDPYVATDSKRPTTSSSITGSALVTGYARAVERAQSADPAKVLAELKTQHDRERSRNVHPRPA